MAGMRSTFSVTAVARAHRAWIRRDRPALDLARVARAVSGVAAEAGEEPPASRRDVQGTGTCQWSFLFPG